MSIFKPTILVTAMASAMGLTTVAHAQDSNTDQSSIQLDPIVVTASKTEEKASQVPARITVISKQEIDQNPVLNLSDVLQKNASIYIKQNGGMGQGTTVSLRGGNPAYTLLLKDGARLNTQNASSPIYPEFLDLSDVDQIEILKGPASVQYGTDAISGVINLISKAPTKTGANLTGVYGENNTYKTIVNADYVDASGFYAQIGGQRLESDGTSILLQQNKNEKAGFDQKGYHAKFGYQNDALDTSIAISENQGTNVYYDSNLNTNTATRNFKNQLINWLGSYKINDALKVNARYSNTKDKELYAESDWQTLQPTSTHYNSETNEGDINTQWNFTKTQNVLVGIDTSHAKYATSYLTNGKHNLDTAGYYLQHQYNNNGLNTQAGVRVEDNGWFGTHTVGQLAARMQVTPTTSIYTNIGTAFKAPSIEQLYGNYYTQNFRSNPDLKPEESTSYEIGLDQKLGYGLSAYLSTYYTDVKNLITSGTINNQPTNINVAKANIKGGELGLKWKHDDLFANAEYAYVKAQNKDNKQDIAYRPRQTYTLTTGYDDGIYGVNVALIARSKANTSTIGIKVPGYATVDLNAFWNVNSNIKLFTNIQNIGDVRNVIVNDFGSQYINSGRLASVGVTLRY
ncbi:TonB-dependent receptor plug domain-containing protein [Acinetobacter brisouii]|uniref:TonB-dependent receptor plug domain-containing protein n=1 Tax=Acinetobacter brisouii TaxID=396323 RepID=UPI0035B24C3F